MSHTKGPWDAYQMGRGIYIGPDVCKMISNGKDLVERKANAHLIKAAPDLLEALQEMIAEVHESGIISFLPEDTDAKQILIDRLEAAQAAVNSALGYSKV